MCLTDLANPQYISGERTGIRTPDTRLRRALLYPAELCTHAILERETRFELATSTLARLRSTAELFPHIFGDLEGTRTLDLQRDRLAF